MPIGLAMCAILVRDKQETSAAPIEV